MPSPRIKLSRHAVRWLWPAAAAALIPKCALCVLGYAGLGTALGLGRPEICGAATGSSFAWVSAFVWIGLASLLATFALLRCKRCWRSHLATSSQTGQRLTGPYSTKLRVFHAIGLMKPPRPG